MIVVQPRTAKGQDTGVKRWQIRVEELLEFYNTLDNMLYHVDIAKSDPYKYLNPGYEWCRFCYAKHECPALRKKIQDDIGCELTDTTDIEPKTFDAATLSKWLDVQKDIKSLLSAINKRAFILETRNPGTIPGYALKDKLADRSWANEEEAKALFLPVLKDKLYKKQMISPTQVEAMLKDLRKGVSVDDERQAVLFTDLSENNTELVARPVTGQSLVKSDRPIDTRTQLQRDFDTLSDASNV
jgi:hypothetical protein